MPQFGRPWQLKSRTLTATNRPLVMGILNVTPDSFFDGGRFFDPGAAIEQGLRLADQGADILDIGGESTRPFATPVEEDREIQRVLPVIRGLVRQVPIPLSVDTYKAAVARRAIDEGVEIVNDVTGLTGDPDMTPLASEAGVGVCVMHMQGRPSTMQIDPTYGDVVQEIYDYLAARRDDLIRLGIAPGRICLDPGIGFGKTHEHNLDLLQHVQRFQDLDCPILIGHSRKGFLGKMLGDKERDRTAASLGVSLAMAARGVTVLRVHDVALTVDALQTFCALID